MFRPDALVAALLFALVLTVYLITTPIALPASGDARAEIARAVSPSTSPSPHHLLLTPTFRAALAPLRSAGHIDASFLALQTLNALAGALAAGLFYLLQRSLGVSRAVSAVATLVLALTYAHWFHAREAETGIIAQTCLIAALTALVAAARAEPGRPRLSLSAAAGTLAALAASYALNVVLVVPALALLLRRAVPPEQGKRPVLTFLAVLAGVVLAAYLIVGGPAAGSAHPAAIATWISAHPSASQLPAVGQISAANAMRSTSGAVNALVGHTAATTAAKQALRAEDPIPVPLGDRARFAVGALLAAGFALSMMLSTPGRLPSAWRGASLTVAILVGSFNMLWLGSDPQFWLPVLPFVIAQTALVATHGPRPAVLAYRALLSISVLTLALSNTASPVPTLLQREGGAEWSAARAYASGTHPDDLLIHAGSWAPYLPAFGEPHHLDLLYGSLESGEPYMASLLHEIETARASGRDVFALEVFEIAAPESIGTWEKIETTHGVDRADIILALQRTCNWQQWQPQPALWSCREH